MYLFIAIILIAELIIVTQIICLIINLDKKVVTLNKKLYKRRPEICKGLTQFKESVAKFVLGVHTLVEFGKKQRNKYLIMMAQNVLIYMLLFLIKSKSKKVGSAMQLALSLRDCWACNS